MIGAESSGLGKISSADEALTGFPYRIEKSAISTSECFFPSSFKVSASRLFNRRGTGSDTVALRQAAREFRGIVVANRSSIPTPHVVFTGFWSLLVLLVVRIGSGAALNIRCETHGKGGPARMLTSNV